LERFRLIYTVIWSKLSKQDAAETVEYLRSRWTEREVQKFRKSLNFEQNIAIFPNMYPKSEYQVGLRKAVISKQSTIIYEVIRQKKQIVIYTILNNKLESNT
jgi:plasmid stabilization system protein ParE